MLPVYGPRCPNRTIITYPLRGVWTFPKITQARVAGRPNLGGDPVDELGRHSGVGSVGRPRWKGVER
jgi:hypothetical protein